MIEYKEFLQGSGSTLRKYLTLTSDAPVEIGAYIEREAGNGRKLVYLVSNVAGQSQEGGVYRYTVCYSARLTDAPYTEDLQRLEQQNELLAGAIEELAVLVGGDGNG